MVESHAPNPRAPRRRSSAELTRAVRDGRRFVEALRALSARAHDPDAADLALASELGRALVRRCDTRHEGWRTLRDALQEVGAEIPWSRAERQAYDPTAVRILADCAAPGFTPLLRVQHAAAQQRARALAAHTNSDDILALLAEPGPSLDREAWEQALSRSVTARSRGQLSARLRDVAPAPAPAPVPAPAPEEPPPAVAVVPDPIG